MESTTRPDTELHPIAEQALLQLEPGPDRRYTLAIGSEKMLARALEKSFAAPDLRYAVTSLISLAKYLDNQQSREAADALLRIAATATRALRARGAADAKLAEDLHEMTTRKFAAFTGTDRSRAAPSFAPKSGAPGALSIASLHALRPRRA